MKLKEITSKQITQTLQLALIYTLFSIPLFTMGAATCAAYYVSLKIINKTPNINIFQLFLKSFKQNLIQGTLMGIITAAILYLLSLYWKNLAQNDFDGYFNIVLGAILSLFGFILIVYSFPTIARYTNKFLVLLKNSAILCLQFFTYTFSILLNLVILYAISGFITYFFPPAIFACFIILPTTTVMLISPTTNKIFKELETPHQPEPEEETQEN